MRWHSVPGGSRRESAHIRRRLCPDVRVWQGDHRLARCSIRRDSNLSGASACDRMDSYWGSSGLSRAPRSGCTLFSTDVHRTRNRYVSEPRPLDRVGKGRGKPPLNCRNCDVSHRARIRPTHDRYGPVLHRGTDHRAFFTSEVIEHRQYTNHHKHTLHRRKI